MILLKGGRNKKSFSVAGSQNAAASLSPSLTRFLSLCVSVSSVVSVSQLVRVISDGPD